MDLLSKNATYGADRVRKALTFDAFQCKWTETDGQVSSCNWTNLRVRVELIGASIVKVVVVVVSLPSTGVASAVRPFIPPLSISKYLPNSPLLLS